MVYPSGEVETRSPRPEPSVRGCSGWFIHPGKLKRCIDPTCWRPWWPSSGWFIHPGKLKPASSQGLSDGHEQGSGWFIHPGKLKPPVPPQPLKPSAPGSGWFIHPGKLKHRLPILRAPLAPQFRMVYPSGEVETGHRGKPARTGPRSGWFIHPGKLKPETPKPAAVVGLQVPDGLSIRGS